jgi:hypothetical protein
MGKYKLVVRDFQIEKLWILKILILVKLDHSLPLDRVNKLPQSRQPTTQKSALLPGELKSPQRESVDMVHL